MTATIDEGQPERAWGVASVPTYPYPAGRAGQPAAAELFDRPEPTTGSLRRLTSPMGTPPAMAPITGPITGVRVTPGVVAPGVAPVESPPTAALATTPAPPPSAVTTPPLDPVDPPRRTRSDRHRRDAPPPGRRFLSRLRTIVGVVVLLAAAAGGGYQIVRHRLAEQAFVDLGGVVLTADAVPVGFAEAVVVKAVGVAQHAHVTAGQKLVTVTTATGNSETLTAPVAGTVAAVKVGVGGVARGGEPIVTLYDQDRLTFQAEVPLEALRRMRLGMTTYIEGPGLARRINATLDHVVPVVGPDQSAGNDRLTVVLVPTAAERATVATLVPGLRFTAKVDTNTATDAVPAVNTG